MAVMRRPAPFRSGPALGSFYPSRTAQISTVLHSDLTVRHQFLGGDGGVTVRLRSCSLARLRRDSTQDVSYCGGRGPLGNMCG